MASILNSAVRLLDEATMTLPTQLALEDESNQYDYAHYRDQARRIATGLLQTRKNMGAPVAVLLPKCCEAVIAFLGILYAGCPYVPLDYDMESHLVRQVLENLRPGHIITDHGKWADLEVSCPLHFYDDLTANPIDNAWIDSMVCSVIDSDPLSILYTIDDDGKPKGIAVNHRSVIDYAAWTAQTFHLSPRTIIANQTAFSAGNALFDIFAPLNCTGKLVITPPTLFESPAKLPEFFAERNITCILWHPTVLTAIAQSGVLGQIRIPRLHVVAFSGGTMSNEMLNLWRQSLPQRVFANLYAPHDCPVACTCYIVDRPFADYDPLPLGRACLNTRIVLLDENDRKAPGGTIGEICLLGSAIPLGLWNVPQSADMVFALNPLQGKFRQVLYRTGELGMISPEGLLLPIERIPLL